MAGSGVFPKTASLDIIYQGDYNSIQSTTAGVLSTYYGQSMLSTQLAANPVISATQWDNLRQDINKCYKHITNADSTILDVDPQDIILAGDANAYKVAADYCETNKAVVAAAQLTSSVDSDSMTATWNGIHTFRMTYSWTSAANANYWFNLGGYFVVDVSGSNGTSSKDIDWRDNILNAIPTQTYTRTNWVNGTNIDVYEYGNNAVYSENYARIYCQKVSATRLDIYVIVSDVDTGDVAALVGPGPAGPAVDENVDTDVAASITRYSSFDSITAPSGVIAVPVEAFSAGGVSYPALNTTEIEFMANGGPWWDDAIFGSAPGNSSVSVVFSNNGTYTMYSGNSGVFLNAAGWLTSGSASGVWIRGVLVSQSGLGTIRSYSATTAWTQMSASSFLALEVTKASSGVGYQEADYKIQFSYDGGATVAYESGSFNVQASISL